jgi:hypothetical protein
MGKLEMNFTAKPVNELDTMRIDLAKQGIDAVLSHITFTDKDTKQIVQYIPSLDVSGYGETEQKAQEMLQLVIEDLFSHLLTLSAKNLQKELWEMGFKQTPMRNKEFSKKFVEENGHRQPVNAVENTIKHSFLSFAA